MPETHLEHYRLDHYNVLEFIAEGGVADVYRAHDLWLDIDFAFKVLKPSRAMSAEGRDRFLYEARQTVKMSHANIVRVHAVGCAVGYYYIAMEMLEGKTLASLIAEQGAMSVDMVRHVIHEVASALDYAHSLDRIHRDVKPSNIFVSPQNKVTLTDFGLVAEQKPSQFTIADEMLGTPSVMSPEQIRGSGITRLSDVYSLGHTAYEALTGRAAFDGTTGKVILEQMTAAPPPIRTLNPSVPKPVEDVVLRALEKDPERRWPSAGAFSAALAAAAEAKAEPWYRALLARLSVQPSDPGDAGRQLVGGGLLVAAIAVLALAGHKLVSGGIDSPPDGNLPANVTATLAELPSNVTLSFTAQRLEPNADGGECALLAWQTSGFDKVEVIGVSHHLSATARVCPKDTTTYALRATGTDLGTVTRTVTVVVRGNAP